ncbi:tetratricopeptide repeat protein [Rhizobium leguminosarum]|uniref:tetratricopeptide repeat protein n=1 Tax=Rhizobium leguminosarum TaxID=384 RepID=UPI003F9440CA
MTIEEHLRLADARVNEIRNHQLELRRISESLLKAEAEIANTKIEQQQKQIDQLNEIIRDPQKYLEFAESAQITLSSLLNELEEKRISGNLNEIRREIEAGSFANAERLIEEIEKSSRLNSKLESEVISARATLAFLDLRFDTAETLSRRAFYLEPSISTLVMLLDQMDMNGNRGKRLAAFNEAKLALPATLAPHIAVRLLAVEALINADAGNLNHAKSIIKTAKSAFNRLQTADSDAAIDLALCNASIATLEEDPKAALKYFRATLKMLRESKGETNLYITRIESNIGACLAELGRLQEAASITRSCVEKLREAGDTGIYHLGIRLNNLGDFLVRSDKADEALDILKESIELAEKNLPSKHPSLIRRRLNLALALLQLGRTNSAIRELKSISVDEAMLGELDRRSLVKAHITLFNCCVETKKWIDALSALLGIQKIGSQYLRDKESIDGLPYAISEVRRIIIYGSFKDPNMLKVDFRGLSRIKLR